MAHSLHLVADDGRTLPERIADHFIARIFTGALVPGERLPPDRELALQLGVDRTSLRMAMQRLSHLGLVKAVRGSGVSVLDYRRHAGVDLLAALFELPQLVLGGSFMLEILDDWLEMVPLVFGRAMRRMTHDSARELDTILSKQLAVLKTGTDIDRLVTLELELQDGIARLVANTTMLLLNNSNRAARRWLTTNLFETADPRELIEVHRRLLHAAIQRGDAPIDDLSAEYREFLSKHTRPMRERLLALPISPTLVSEGKPA